MTPDKGHDVLLDALATATDLSWRCECVGSLVRDPAFADGVRRRARDIGLGDRVRFPGALHRPGARPRVRRRGPARARLARRDVRHGRHRGPGPRRAGPRHRGRRGDRSARPWRGRHPAGAAGPARRPGGPRRRAARLARGRRAARPAAPRGARAARDAAPLGGHRVRRRRRPCELASAEGVAGFAGAAR